MAAVMSPNTSWTGCSPLISRSSPRSGIEGEQRLCLEVEHLETVGDGGLGVVSAPFLVGASQEPVSQLVVADAEMHDSLELDSLDLLGRRVCLLGLAECPRKTVEYVSAVFSRLEHGLGQHLEHKLVRYEIAPLQVVSGHSSNLRPTSHFGAQESSAGQVRDAVVSSQFRRLRAFPGPRVRHQKESHPRHDIGGPSAPIARAALRFGKAYDRPGPQRRSPRDDPE